ncbi:MAG: deoxyribonuclease IV [Pseudonocardiales bacterium]|nr:deoxyribonuclease IV [Pseudonocardiales bacterium]MBV9029726.1 deoxyribonuclease IV [Pseudonocardiales bacterium]
MRIGAHVSDDDPVSATTQRNAEAVQFFLADPQDWKAPGPHPQAARLLSADLEIYVHSPYVINVASLNNRIRIPSRKLVAQHAAAAATVGARGLVVHGGHVARGEDPAQGVENWRKMFARQAAEGGFGTRILVENTAGGDNAMARRFDSLARLWDAIGDYDVGFCLDTCHAFAAGEDLTDAVDRVRAITGRIDLVHCNNSRDEFGSARDRHARLRQGTIDAEQLVAVCAAAGATVVLETDPDTQREDIAWLREQLP